MSISLQAHGLQLTRPPCPSPTPRAYSNSYPSHQWYHPTISSSVVPFSSLLQSFPASGSFPKSWFFPSGGQSIGVSASASVLLVKDSLEDWHIETQSLQWFNKSIQVVLVVKNPPANAGEITDVGSIPGLGRCPGGEHGNSLQYSCLENPMDRGAWWAIFFRVTKNQIWLKWLSIHQSVNIFHINSVAVTFPLW